MVRYEKIKKKHINSFMKFIDSIKSEFVELRNLRTNNPLEEYLVSNNLRMILALEGSKVIGYLAYVRNAH